MVNLTGLTGLTGLNPLTHPQLLLLCSSIVLTEFLIGLSPERAKTASPSLEKCCLRTAVFKRLSPSRCSTSSYLPEQMPVDSVG